MRSLIGAAPSWRPISNVLVLCAGLAVGCGPRSSDDGFLKAGPSAPFTNLFDEIGRAQIAGAASAVPAAGAPEAPGVEVFSLDFEDGGLGPLQVFTGVGGPAAEAEAARVVQGAEAHGGGQSARLKASGLSHGLSLRTAPMRVSPLSTWDLSYRIKGEDVRAGQGDVYGGASVIQYSFPGKDDAQVAAAMADPEQELAARVNKGKNPASFWVPSRYGDTPWTVDHARFTTLPEATHMVVSLDLSRKADDRGDHKASGTLWLDDVKLVERAAPLIVRYRDLDDGSGPAHPLKMRLQHVVPDLRKGTDARYALYAPAPSSLGFDVKVPEGGVLSFSYALAPEALAAGRGDVTFVVTAAPRGGQAREVFKEGLSHDESTRWFEGEADLSALAGKDVTLTLSTTADGATDETGLTALPGAAAVWGYPVVHSRTLPGRTVVLVAFDTLPSKKTSTYGYPVETTPELSRIAARGVTFERAVSASPWTLGGFGSMLTGLDAARHRAGERQYGTQAWRRPMADAFVTLPERLRAAGWDTRAWINNPYLTAEFGLDQGFSHFVDVGTRSEKEASRPIVDQLEDYLAKPVGYDRLLFIHLMDPHGPYRPNDAFASKYLTDKDYKGTFEKIVGGYEFLDLTQGKLKATDADKVRLTHFYEAVIAYADSLLGQIFDLSRKVSAADRYALFVTADHGEEQWEHGLYEHGHQMYDELLKVPLVVYIPGQTKAGRRVAGPVGSFDVAPSILSFAGLPLPQGVDAVALQPWLEDGDAPTDRVLYGHQMLYGTQRIAVERDGLKLLYNEQNTDTPEARSPRPKTPYELYDLRADPGETQNLFKDRLKDGRALMEILYAGFVRSLGGHVVVWLDGGDEEAHIVEGSITLAPGSSWLRYSKDLLWPMRNGTQGRPGKAGRRGASPELMNVAFQAPRGLMGFTIDKGHGPFTIDLTLDGQPLSLDRLVVGSGAFKPEALPFTATAAQLALAPDALARAGAAAGGPRVVVALLDETPELVGAGGGALSADVAEQLRALGYLTDEPAPAPATPASHPDPAPAPDVH